MINKTESQSDFIITMQWQYHWYSTPSCWGWQLLLPIIPTHPFVHFLVYECLKLISVQFSHSVISDSLWPHGLQHTKHPCPSPTPWVFSDSCPLSRWCHPTVSSSVIPFSSHLQSFLASGAFPMSQLFASGGQSVGVSASASAHQVGISLFNEHPGLISFRMDWLDLLAVQGNLKSLLQHHHSKASILQCSAFFIVQLSHHTWPLETP